MKSAEVSMALSLLVIFYALQGFAPLMVEWSVEFYQNFFVSDFFFRETLTQRTLLEIAFQAGSYFLLLSGPLLLVSMLVGVAANVLQVGFLFTTKPLHPKPPKFNFSKVFKSFFSSKNLVDLIKSTIKVTVLGIILYQGIRDNIIMIPMMMNATLASSVAKMFEMTMAVVMKAIFAFAALSAGDYAYSWWKYEKDMKMSKEEVKEEHKNAEGNPETKRRIRSKQREMSMMRMMNSVPDADVVITNPTHYAVALRYHDGEDEAPIVLAKGQDYVALRIKQVATEHGIEIVENKPLAQALYKQCEIGDLIPAGMYKAVAEILAAIYRVKNRMAGDTR